MTSALRPARSALLGRGSPTWVLAGTAVNAIATYGLLLVVARVLGPARTADFSVFWALSVTAGLGVFLPLEQETARRVARLAAGAGVRPVWRRAVTVAGVVTVLLAAAGFLGWHAAADGLQVASAFAVAVVGYTLQFPGRGVLSGRRKLAAYGAVTGIDAVLRLVFTLVLAATGIRTVAAYDAAVAASALLAGVAAVVFGRVLSHREAGSAPVVGLAHDALRLVVAALCMQGLLNNGTLVARFFATADQQDLAGRLLVVMTIARLPVFLFQSLQATYLTRLAAGMHRRDERAVRRLAGLLGAAVLTLAGLLVVGAALVGPRVVTLFFGARYEVSRLAVILVAASVAAYLVASVANDVSVAVGAHRRIAVAWPLALVLALTVALTVTNLTVRSTVPLGLGALVAAAVLLPGVLARISSLRAGPGESAA